jgi:hypothetical protein
MPPLEATVAEPACELDSTFVFPDGADLNLYPVFVKPRRDDKAALSGLDTNGPLYKPSITAAILSIPNSATLAVRFCSSV